MITTSSLDQRPQSSPSPDGRENEPLLAFWIDEMPRLQRAAAAGAADGTNSAVLRAEHELLTAAYQEVARRYERLRTAAQAGVIEARTSRRDPLTPIREALAELDELPAPGARLADLPLSTAAAWPRGSKG